MHRIDFDVYVFGSMVGVRSGRYFSCVFGVYWWMCIYIYINSYVYGGVVCDVCVVDVVGIGIVEMTLGALMG